MNNIQLFRVRQFRDVLRPLFGSALLVASLGASALGEAPLTTLTFDELPFQSVNGLTYAGVTFDFSVDGVASDEAFYNSFGPGILTYIDDPSLTGDSAGLLGLEFAFPSTVLRFGVALNTGAALSPGVRVELFGADDQSLGVMDINTAPMAGDLSFSESQFEYVGEAIARAVIDFEHEPGSFAVDNLTFAIVPEPCSFVVTFMAMLTVIGGTRRRKA